MLARNFTASTFVQLAWVLSCFVISTSVSFIRPLPPRIVAFNLIFPRLACVRAAKQAGKAKNAANPANKKQKLQDKQKESLRRVRQLVLNSECSNHCMMLQQCLQWLETLPRGLSENIDRSIMLGSYDALDNGKKGSEDDTVRLTSYMNKWRLLSLAVRYAREAINGIVGFILFTACLGFRAEPPTP